ncbi:MAG: hypothetical protein DMF61_10565 [Blastocatellia bacterium AA13]|nr:MAG: hypothetical protein DMF61_10565 [Blastocatellia bacterium AA13]
MKISITLVALFILSTVSAAAQESMGGGGSTRRNTGPTNVPSLGVIVITVSGSVLKVDAERKAIQVRDKRNDKEVGVLLDAKCKIKCDEKQFGKKELKLEEIEKGFLVEMLVRRDDMHVTEMKVKKPKESGVEK